MKIEFTEDFIKHLEWLARIELDNSEKQRLKEELAILLRYIDDVLSIDIEGYSPYIYPKPSMELREDIPFDDKETHSYLTRLILEEGFVKGPVVTKKK